LEVSACCARRNLPFFKRGFFDPNIFYGRVSNLGIFFHLFFQNRTIMGNPGVTITSQDIWEGLFPSQEQIEARRSIMARLEEIKERVFLEHAASLPPEVIARSDFSHLSGKIKRQKRNASGGTADAACGTAEDTQRNARNAWKNCR
jgi:hypothetical protein